MDRIINVKVSGNHLTKDGKNAGTRGEANATTLRITFDEGWDGYAKSVVFLDAHGMNPTRLTLTTDLLDNEVLVKNPALSLKIIDNYNDLKGIIDTSDWAENIEEHKDKLTSIIGDADLVEDIIENPTLFEGIIKSARTYLVPMPQEPLWFAGELTFSVEGYIDGKRQRSVSDTLEVSDSIVTDVVKEPTPTQAEEMQRQYDSIMGDIQKAFIYRNEAETFAENAEASAVSAGTSATNAENSAKSAEQTKKEVEDLKKATIEEVDTHKQEALTEIGTTAESATRSIGTHAQIATENIAARESKALQAVETREEEALLEIGATAESATRSIGTHAQIATENINALVGEARNAQASAEENANVASKARIDAILYADKAKEEAEKAEDYAAQAEKSATNAGDYAWRAENSVGKTSYIGKNGNWYAWDSRLLAFYDTGVKAQSGSTVYKGDKPPADADIWIDTSGEESGEVVTTPNDAKITSKYSVPSMFTMIHYIQNSRPGKDEVLCVLGNDVAFEDIGWNGDKETKMFILKKGRYRFSSICQLEVKEDGICIMTRNASEYHTLCYFVTLICESGIKFFDFVDIEEHNIYYTDSPNREFSFANVDSILTFDNIGESYTTLPCIHLMSPNGTAYMVSVNDDGELEATPHDE